MASIINVSLNTIMPEHSVKIHHTNRSWLNADLEFMRDERHLLLVIHLRSNTP